MTAPLAAVLVLIAGHGLLSTLVPLSAVTAGFPELTVELIGSTYFGGMVMGCIATPRIVARAGHIRAFAALAAVATALAALVPEPARGRADDAHRPRRLVRPQRCHTFRARAVRGLALVAKAAETRERTVSAEVLVQDTTIAARDGYALAATVFTSAEPPRAAVLINSATAVPRKIYRGFAAYLAERGCAVVTYDYRGIGGSRPPSLKGFETRMRDWAALDATAVVDHVHRVWPDLPLLFVGHSFGGQALGLTPNNTLVSRALFVAAQAGYWRLFTTPENFRAYGFMRLIGVPVTHLLGYTPGRLGIGEDLPKGVFLEWTRWVGRPRYFFDDPTLEALQNFPRFTGDLRAIGLTDDSWATAPAIDLLLAGFTNARREHRQIAPRDVGAKKIGHFGFFRPEHRDTLWRDAADWLVQEAPS